MRVLQRMERTLCSGFGVRIYLGFRVLNIKLNPKKLTQNCLSHVMCRCATEGMRPPVDLEDTALLRRMLALFRGTPPSALDASVEKCARPASPAVCARLVGLFSRSIAAASMFPENLRVSKTHDLCPLFHISTPCSVPECCMASADASQVTQTHDRACCGVHHSRCWSA